MKIIFLTFVSIALSSSVVLADSSQSCEPVPDWSCGAIQTDIYWKAYGITGKGMTAADAWQDLLASAAKTDCTGCRLVKFLDRESPSKSPDANLVQSCVKN